MNSINRLKILFALMLLVGTTFRCSAQTSNELKIVSPFDSLQITEVLANGNIKTGNLEIVITFKNDYSKLAGVYLSLGGFYDFGITDSKGRNYKIHTNVNAVNTNKGYSNIPFIQFGDHKFDWVTYVKQEISSGDDRKLSVRLSKIDKGTQQITNFHVRCILSLDYGHVGDKMYSVEHIKINWK